MNQSGKMTATDWARLDELLAKCDENQGLSWKEAKELDVLASKAQLEEDENA